MIQPSLSLFQQYRVEFKWILNEQHVCMNRDSCLAPSACLIKEYQMHELSSIVLFLIVLQLLSNWFKVHAHTFTAWNHRPPKVDFRITSPVLSRDIYTDKEC
ncbi:uncharacterized protein LOC122575611 [Bombus pyrosoma]|uniref:uncharacterized protein LOC122575611 n=1 Tax=Bombus pyrosoma TaxID=396416 RepID=UPI001CB8B9E7|nr:uncharacterized protein LOC122575611 [Bombus pyrosoma]